MRKILAIRKELEKAKNELAHYKDATERLRTQLAGCGVAARDGSKEQEANILSYGWSPAYADVLDLRREFDRFKKIHYICCLWWRLDIVIREFIKDWAYAQGRGCCRPGKGRNQDDLSV